MDETQQTLLLTNEHFNENTGSLSTKQMSNSDDEKEEIYKVRKLENDDNQDPQYRRITICETKDQGQSNSLQEASRTMNINEIEFDKIWEEDNDKKNKDKKKVKIDEIVKPGAQISFKFRRTRCHKKPKKELSKITETNKFGLGLNNLNLEIKSVSTAESPSLFTDDKDYSHQKAENSWLPDYIKNFMKRVNSHENKEFRKAFYASYTKDENKIQEENIEFPKLPIDGTFDMEIPKSQKEFIYDLEIVTNQNQKERIKVTFQAGKSAPTYKKIPNPVDKSLKDEFFNQFNFTMDYRSGYAPIAIQEQQEAKEFTYKDHFIRKKQSCANARLKRVCGVSYVKTSESQQLNVDHIFEKLPPLVFQGSTGCNLLEDYEDMLRDTFFSLIHDCEENPLLVTLLDVEDDILMREYLNFPERRFELAQGKFWIVKSFEDLWHFFTDRIFVCIHLLYDDKVFIKKPLIGKITKNEITQLLYESNIQIGLLCRKSISGKKAFLKTFFDDYSDSDSEVDEEEVKDKKEEQKKKKKDATKLKKTSHKAKKEKDKEKEKGKEKEQENGKEKGKEKEKEQKEETLKGVLQTKSPEKRPPRTRSETLKLKEKEQSSKQDEEKAPATSEPTVKNLSKKATNKATGVSEGKKESKLSNPTKTDKKTDKVSPPEAKQNIDKEIAKPLNKEKVKPNQPAQPKSQPQAQGRSQSQPQVTSQPQSKNVTQIVEDDDDVIIVGQTKKPTAPILMQPNAMRPNTMIPSTMISSTLIPNTTLPNPMRPNTMIPNTMVPNTMIPNTMMPNPLVPNMGMPYLQPNPLTASPTINPLTPGYNPLYANQMNLMRAEMMRQAYLGRMYQGYPAMTPMVKVIHPGYLPMQSMYPTGQPFIPPISQPTIRVTNPYPFVNLANEATLARNLNPQHKKPSIMANKDPVVIIDDEPKPTLPSQNSKKAQPKKTASQSDNKMVAEKPQEVKKVMEEKKNVEEKKVAEQKKTVEEKKNAKAKKNIEETKILEDKIVEEKKPAEVKETPKKEKLQAKKKSSETIKPEKAVEAPTIVEEVKGDSSVPPRRVMHERISKQTAKLVNKILTEENENVSSESDFGDEDEVTYNLAPKKKVSNLKSQRKTNKKQSETLIEEESNYTASEDPTSESYQESEEDEEFTISEDASTSDDEEQDDTESKFHVKRSKLTKKEENALLKYFEEEEKVSINTLSIRVELYTQEESWKTASSHTKDLLYTFSEIINEQFAKRFRSWTKSRLDLTKKSRFAKLEEISKNLYHFELDYEYDSNSLKMSKPLTQNRNWNFSPKIKKYQGPVEEKPKEKLSLAKGNTYCFAELQDIYLDAKDLSKQVLPLKLPLYLITTRDSFAYDLIEKVTILNMRGRKVVKTEYFFDPKACPSNFKSFLDKFPDYRVGVVTYNNFYSHEELIEIENKCYETERKFFSNHYLPMTGQMSCTNDKVKRTKFFFGARYIWSRQQLSDPHSMVAAGIRVDVSEPPKWTKDLVEHPMVEEGIIPKDFINSIALNVYHDGKEGLAQHFDDAVRFRQPIFTLRIFSDSRLSFGSQFYGFCNGAFCVPMPRGCITVLEEESYAANGIKHCVRPCDMTGKSAALILRQMHHKVIVSEAKIYDEFVDFPCWFSTLSLDPNAVPYSEQKRIEAEDALKGKK